MAPMEDGALEAPCAGLNWLITGASSGIGHALADLTLRRGDRVAVTARDACALAPLVALGRGRASAIPMDLLDTASIHQAGAEALRVLGKIDVVVNNAGVGLFGAVEECSEDEVRDTFAANVFGTLALTRTVLPDMRRRGNGRIVTIGSIGGVEASPCVGVYNASKAALEALMESLRAEVAALGIAVHIVEPGLISTGFRARGIARAQNELADYAAIRAPISRNLDAPYPPEATAAEVAAQHIVALATGSGSPFRLPVGHGAVDRMNRKIKALRSAVDTSDPSSWR